MENNTITPSPTPKPQPVAPMPTFGTNNNAPAQPTQPIPPAQPVPPIPPAQPAPSAPIAPAAPAAPVSPAAPAAPVAPSTPAPQPAPQAPISMPTSTPPAAAAPATNLAEGPAGTPAAAPVTPTTTPVTPAAAPGMPAPEQPITQPMAQPVAQPIAQPQPAERPTTQAQPPINKGRLGILIGIIAAFVVAGLIAAVLIIFGMNNTPDPTARVEAALANLSDPAKAPTAVTGELKIVNGESPLSSANFVLEGDNLFLSYKDVYSLINKYLGLSAVDNKDSIASLLAIAELVKFAENKWWQIPTEDLTVAADYRAHPFLVLDRADSSTYYLKIEKTKFAEFLGIYGIHSNVEGTNCVDGPAGTNCGPTAGSGADSALDPGLLAPILSELPDNDELITALSELDIMSEIDSEDRFTQFSCVFGDEEEDIVVSLKLNLLYGSSAAPEEYHPVTDLITEFMKTIGY